MNVKDLLIYELKIGQIHIDRLTLALGKIGRLYPFTEKTFENMSDEDLGYFELFTTRLGKLQDLLGEKMFPLVLDLLGEGMDNKSFIDKLNRLESLNILPSVAWWQDLRKLRNTLTHEYPDNPVFILDTLNAAFIQAKRLVVFWESLVEFIHSRI